MLVGAHVSPTDPVAAAAAQGADCAQFFLGNPQSWRSPRPRADAAELRTSGMPLYVHAPYLINMASANTRVRVPSRRMLQETCDGAAAIGARAVVVHGGSVADEADLEEGFRRWRRGLERLETTVPVYVENTAGGDHAMARRIAMLARLWEHIGDLVGLCFDTCHAHAGGEPLPEAVDQVIAVTGGIDLLHCNDSRDEAGSGRDRHEHLGKGRIDPDALAEAVRRARAPVVVETADEGRAGDLAFVRACFDQPVTRT